MNDNPFVKRIGLLVLAFVVCHRRRGPADGDDADQVIRGPAGGRARAGHHRRRHRGRRDAGAGHRAGGPADGRSRSRAHAAAGGADTSTDCGQGRGTAGDGRAEEAGARDDGREEAGARHRSEAGADDRGAEACSYDRGTEARADATRRRSRPAAAPAKAYSAAEVEAIVREVWPDDLEEQALAIAKRESKLIPTSRNYCCYGVFAIYYEAGKRFLNSIGVTSADQLFDPWVNVRAAFALYGIAGWQPWAL